MNEPTLTPTQQQATIETQPSGSPVSSEEMVKVGEDNDLAIATELKAQIVAQLKVYADESEEDQARYDATDQMFSLLLKYLTLAASLQDDLQWTGLDITIIPDSDSGRLIEVLADPFLVHTAGRADGHWMIYQFQDQDTVQSSLLWSKNGLTYVDHLRIQDKLIVVGNRTSSWGSVFAGLWQLNNGNWEGMPISAFPDFGGILSQTGDSNHLLYGDSGESRLGIELIDLMVDITDDSDIQIKLHINLDKGEFISM
ncbi:hypothetical protein [Cohnella mopanensis]|uniref:hypothetical protein n=1 Tax=Cohnella mopanensis TaxID=2911966 RepID=UPI001EF8AE98|nr:hypothetical protein [Cohnella mopanensis]